MLRKTMAHRRRSGDTHGHDRALRGSVVVRVSWRPLELERAITRLGIEPQDAKPPGQWFCIERSHAQLSPLVRHTVHLVVTPSRRVWVLARGSRAAILYDDQAHIENRGPQTVVATITLSNHLLSH